MLQRGESEGQAQPGGLMSSVTALKPAPRAFCDHSLGWHGAPATGLGAILGCHILGGRQLPQSLCSDMMLFKTEDLCTSRRCAYTHQPQLVEPVSSGKYGIPAMRTGEQGARIHQAQLLEAVSCRKSAHAIEELCTPAKSVPAKSHQWR